MKKKGVIECTIGALFLLAGLGLAVSNVLESTNAARLSAGVIDALNPQISVVAEEEEIPDYVLNPEMEMPIKIIDGMEYSMIVTIPALDVELPVLADYKQEWLKIAPTRFWGSVYTHNVSICAHDYPAHFGRLNQLVVGDEVWITDMDGHAFQYEIMEILDVSPSRTEEFTENGYDLTLFSCLYGGASRIVVHCMMVDPIF